MILLEVSESPEQTACPRSLFWALAVRTLSEGTFFFPYVLYKQWGNNCNRSSIAEWVDRLAEMLKAAGSNPAQTKKVSLFP